MYHLLSRRVRRQGIFNHDENRSLPTGPGSDQPVLRGPAGPATSLRGADFTGQGYVSLAPSPPMARARFLALKKRSRWAEPPPGRCDRGRADEGVGPTGRDGQNHLRAVATAAGPTRASALRVTLGRTTSGQLRPRQGRRGRRPYGSRWAEPPPGSCDRIDLSRNAPGVDGGLARKAGALVGRGHIGLAAGRGRGGRRAVLLRLPQMSGAVTIRY